ncbi:MAG: DUF2306 domain-containing protein [Devosia sp.]
MTSLALRSRPRPPASPADWLIPVALLALAFVPVVAGAFRLTTLAAHVAVTPENARFLASPVPVALHIVSVTIYSILGAFQFSPGVRRRWPSWHRAAGRVLVVAGLVAALSGLWMALFYAIVPADPPLLHVFRLTFGAAMAASIILGFIAIRQRKISEHQVWMRRAYAIGMGAGTQGLIQIPYIMILGQPDSFIHALLMGGAWAFNLGIAEWLNDRQGLRS